MKDIVNSVGVSLDAARKISAFRGKRVLPRRSKDSEVLYVPSVRDQSVEQLLRNIYSCKEGEINGELLTFMSDKVRPEVREFIKSQLLKVQKPINSHGLSDDDLSALALQQGDTADSYHERVRSWLDKQIEVAKSNEE